MVFQPGVYLVKRVASIIIDATLFLNIAVLKLFLVIQVFMKSFF